MEKRTDRKLRFSDFSDNLPSMPLCSLATKISDGLHSTPRYDESGEYYFINGNNLNDGKIVVHTGTKRVNSAQFQIHQRPLNHTTILLSINGTIGSLALYNDEKVILGKSACYINVKEEYNRKFVYYSLQCPRLVNHFTAELTGTTIKNLSLTTVKNALLSVPSLAEQKKIAAFLSGVDDRIQQLTRKKSLLEQYKKGVMQQLFSQQFRFKDDEGNEYPLWDEMAFGQLGEIVTGKTPSTANPQLWNGPIQFVTPTDIVEGEKYQRLTTRTVVATPGLRILPKGSILFTCIASIGKMALTLKPSTTNQQINAIVPRIDYSSEFIYYYIMHMADYIKSTQSNTTLPIINKTEFSRFRIQMPSNAEQLKIANVLSALDEKVFLVSQQISKAEQFKKGLLQQMFV